MAATFSVDPHRYVGRSEPFKRPKEFASFSYDKDHKFHLNDSSIKWYYPPHPLNQPLYIDLSKGFSSFVKHDDSQDEHLDSLLKTIAHHESETKSPIDANIVTWRGMMTKIMAAPFDDDGFEMNATSYRGTIFIEENHAFKVKRNAEQNANQSRRRGPIPPEVMQFWGYKFETLCTLPRPWGETSRDYIEGREDEIVNNNEQYCSVVRTGIGKTILCLGGEVDALWDSKPRQKGAPINWVELKTSAEIRSANDQFFFNKKLMKFWIQSFLLGVPKIIVGFRTRDGFLTKIEEMETMSIPNKMKSTPNAPWDGDVCINFAAGFLEWLRQTINDDGVWRIRRLPKSYEIEVFRIEEAGHGEIITDEFMNWRIKLELGLLNPPAEDGDPGPPPPEQQDTETTMSG
ncbi:protein RAI1 [Podospora australis]|uniref:Decapping nuclease n=1 Tax=Podospora australis TaxID=1536484 RepID=A0AAN7AEJ6_9PEZI|nr:protein RAI1 [Podospora australis]